MMRAANLSADRIGGAVWVAFGAAIAYGSWTMDRLTSLGVHPATAPGLVPGLLGLGFIAFGLVLLLRSEHSSEAIAPDTAEKTPDPGFAIKRVAVSWLVCMSYAGVLLGCGIHYWILTTAFLILHLLLIDESDRVPATLSARRLVIAALLAPAIATVVMLVFQHIFLVRLP
jgi:hypothetical protein